MCSKSEICSLIRKILPESKYQVTCSSSEDLNNDFLEKLDTNNFDCLILDKDINRNLPEELTEKFSKVSILYLPSFESGTSENKIIKYIPEPLRLSELHDAIEGVFKLKSIE